MAKHIAFSNLYLWTYYLCECGEVNLPPCPLAEMQTCNTSQCWSCLTPQPCLPADQVSDTELTLAQTEHRCLTVLHVCLCSVEPSDGGGALLSDCSQEDHHLSDLQSAAESLSAPLESHDVQRGPPAHSVAVSFWTETLMWLCSCWCCTVLEEIRYLDWICLKNLSCLFSCGEILTDISQMAQ